MKNNFVPPKFEKPTPDPVDPVKRAKLKAVGTVLGIAILGISYFAVFVSSSQSFYGAALCLILAYVVFMPYFFGIEIPRGAGAHVLWGNEQKTNNPDGQNLGSDRDPKP